jgi:Rod binding domain-containing protein
MHIQPHHGAAKVSQLPLQSLAGNPNISDEDKVAEVSRQFEAVLLRQIMQQAHKPTPDAAGNSLSSDVYSDMINQQLAQSISQSGAFGLAKNLQGELTRQVLPHGGTHALTPNKSAKLPQLAHPVLPKDQAHSSVNALKTLPHDRKH